MGYQSDVKIGGPLRLPASATVLAVSAATIGGRGLTWDSANAVLELSADDDRVDFIAEELHSGDSTVSCIPFEANRNFRVRLAASPGTLAIGKLLKVSASGLFALGGAASDVNVASIEAAAGANGAALVRPLPATVTT